MKFLHVLLGQFSDGPRVLGVFSKHDYATSFIAETYPNFWFSREEDLKDGTKRSFYEPSENKPADETCQFLVIHRF